MITHSNRFVQSGTGAVSRSFSDKLKEFVTPEDFGAIGDSITNDTTIVQLALNYCATNGIVLYLNNLYSVDALHVNSPNPGFGIIGKRGKKSGFKKHSAISSYVLYIQDALDFDLYNFLIDVNYTALGTAFGGLSVLRSSYGNLKRITINDVAPSGAAILVYTGGVEDTYRNIIVDGCISEGNTVAGNGILLADMIYSGIRNCYTYGSQGSPGIGLQLKNACRHCFIENSISKYCASGAALGSDGNATTGPQYNKINDIKIISPITGFNIFDGDNNDIDGITIDHLGASYNGNSIDIRTVSYTPSNNNIQNIVVKNLPETSYASRIRNGSNNIVGFNRVERLNGSSLITLFDAGTSSNEVSVHFTRPDSNDLTGLVSDLGTNTFAFETISDQIIRKGTNGQPSLISGLSTCTFHSSLSHRIDSSANANYQFANGSSATLSGITISVPSNNFLASLAYNITSNYWNMQVSGANAYKFDASQIYPATDNTKNLGSSLYRFGTIYAGTGTINTSDEREKQDIDNLNESEKRVAVSIKGLIRKFRFKDSVLSKFNNARTHVGVIAQEIKKAFENEGLIAENYALLCHDVWDETPEIKDENGNITQQYVAAGDRYGIRYDELFAFIISAL